MDRKRRFRQRDRRPQRGDHIRSEICHAYGYRGYAEFRKQLVTKKGGWDPAIADYSEAIKLDPKWVWAYSSRGFAYKNKGDFDNALPDCSQAIKLDPKYGDGYSCRGAVYFGKKDYQHAIDDYTVALTLDPKDGAAHW